MVLFGFGDFDYACRNVPSLPVCNLFFRQLLNHPLGETAPATALLGLPDSTNATYASALAAFGNGGVNPACIIPRMQAAGGATGYGNIANIIACGLSVLIGLALAFAALRRAAAVARIEMFVLLGMYALLQGAQLADTGGLLRAGSYALTWISAVHVGLLVSFFWVLTWVALLSLQFVEDGTLPALIPMAIGMVIFFVGPAYIALDIGLTITSYFQSDPASKLHSIWLFVLTLIWPAAAAAFYFAVQLGVVVRVLKEKKPLALFSGAAILFVLAQGAYFALSYKICSGSGAKIDGSFVATILESAAVVVLFVAWRSITEDSWDDYTVASGSVFSQ